MRLKKGQKLRVAAYCRVSTRSDEQIESLNIQKIHYEGYIASREDWQFAGLYFDEGITGTKKDKRPELKRLMQKVFLLKEVAAGPQQAFVVFLQMRSTLVMLFSRRPIRMIVLTVI
ncbi:MULTISPECIES: recombinase family protein [unclassified Ruminococcus]|uniref:recombinase family protein n=1 Tax=unclassified Ruminococcus TaxID=2608920 RepID=UPI002109EC9B|nr:MULTISPECIES: recombinase family protein [unclassified Ruminococcus]